MGYRKRHYPMGGKNHWETTDMIVCRSFRIDAGAQAAGTATTETFPIGSVILGWRARVTEAFTSGGSATVELGFTSTTQYSTSTIAVGTLVLNYFVGPANDGDTSPLILSAADTFDCVVATATLTAGKFDVDVYYAPPIWDALGAEFKEYVTT